MDDFSNRTFYLKLLLLLTLFTLISKASDLRILPELNYYQQSHSSRSISLTVAFMHDLASANQMGDVFEKSLNEFDDFLQLLSDETEVDLERFMTHYYPHVSYVPAEYAHCGLMESLLMFFGIHGADNPIRSIALRLYEWINSFLVDQCEFCECRIAGTQYVILQNKSVEAHKNSIKYSSITVFDMNEDLIDFSDYEIPSYEFAIVRFKNYKPTKPYNSTTKSPSIILIPAFSDDDAERILNDENVLEWLNSFKSIDLMLDWKYQSNHQALIHVAESIINSQLIVQQCRTVLSRNANVANLMWRLVFYGNIQKLVILEDKAMKKIKICEGSFDFQMGVETAKLILSKEELSQESLQVFGLISVIELFLSKYFSMHISSPLDILRKNDLDYLFYLAISYASNHDINDLSVHNFGQMVLYCCDWNECQNMEFLKAHKRILLFSFLSKYKTKEISSLLIKEALGPAIEADGMLTKRQQILLSFHFLTNNNPFDQQMADKLLLPKYFEVDINDPWLLYDLQLELKTEILTVSFTETFDVKARLCGLLSKVRFQRLILKFHENSNATASQLEILSNYDVFFLYFTKEDPDVIRLFSRSLMKIYFLELPTHSMFDALLECPNLTLLKFEDITESLLTYLLDLFIMTNMTLRLNHESLGSIREFKYNEHVLPVKVSSSSISFLDLQLFDPEARFKKIKQAHKLD